jgi:hypothetical protein
MDGDSDDLEKPTEDRSGAVVVVGFVSCEIDFAE